MTISPPAPASTAVDALRVLVVDDEGPARADLAFLLQQQGSVAHVATAADATEALRLLQSEQYDAVFLDVRMPGSSGLDLQQHLASTGVSKPIVFLTGHGDIPMSVQAMKAGAVDFLTKPVRDQTLLDAVTAGIERDIADRANARVVRQHAERYATLTPRETQVMREVALGRLNKQIAYDLGITEITVKLHRSNVMRKMQAGSVGELIRAWEKLPAEVREPAAA